MTLDELFNFAKPQMPPLERDNTDSEIISAGLMPDTEETLINDYRCQFYYLHHITAVSILWFLKNISFPIPAEWTGKQAWRTGFRNLCDCKQREILMLYLRNFSND